MSTHLQISAVTALLLCFTLQESDVPAMNALLLLFEVWRFWLIFSSLVILDINSFLAGTITVTTVTITVTTIIGIATVTISHF